MANLPSLPVGDDSEDDVSGSAVIHILLAVEIRVHYCTLDGADYCWAYGVRQTRLVGCGATARLVRVDEVIFAVR